MPEHVHIVLWPENETISSILSTIKQSVSKRAILWLKDNAPDFLERLLDAHPGSKSSYRFWQRGGGYDRNLRSVRDIHEKVRYLHENPVRRGLVSRPIDWYWSSASAWESGVDEPLMIDRHSLPPLTPTDDDQASGLMH